MRTMLRFIDFRCRARYGEAIEDRPIPPAAKYRSTRSEIYKVCRWQRSDVGLQIVHKFAYFKYALFFDFECL